MRVNPLNLSSAPVAKAEEFATGSPPPFAAVGKGLSVSFGFLSYGMMAAMVSWNLLYLSFFSSLLQTDAGILRLRGKRISRKIRSLSTCSSVHIAFGQLEVGQSHTKQSHRIFTVASMYPSVSCVMVLLSVVCFQKVKENCFLISVGKEKGNQGKSLTWWGGGMIKGHNGLF